MSRDTEKETFLHRFVGYTGSDYTGTAVLYARYSSHNQREVSIDDQLKIDNDYCVKEKLKVVNIYVDRAMTGTTDNRPDFQRMIANAPESNYVIVYKMDRFSRDKYDAPIYKKRLEKCGVIVISATERIPEGSSGVFLEKVLEAQAAFYSMQLSENVQRGMNSNAENCMANGVHTFGYDIDDNQHYVINEEEAKVVREVFRRYINGETMFSIAADLAARGYKTSHHKPASPNWVQGMLHNEKYIGTYRWKDHVTKNGMPAIISLDMFFTAQNAPRKKVRMNEEWTDYPLSGKIFCGICGHPMHGQSAKNRYGTRYEYYACNKRKGCGRKPIRREVIEDTLVEGLGQKADDPATARTIAEQICEQYGKSEGDTEAAIKAVRKELKAIERKKDKLLDSLLEEVISQDEYKAKKDVLEEEHERLTGRLGVLRAEDSGLDIDELTEFILHGFETLGEGILFDGFLNRVYVFENYMVATMNYVDGDTNSLAEVRMALEDAEINPADLVKSSNEIELAGQLIYCTNFKPILLYHGIGIVLPFAA